MSHTNTVNGTYGSQFTPCKVFTYQNRNGSIWYAVEGSKNVNCTYSPIEEGIDVESLKDHNFFTAGVEIDSEETLSQQVES